MLYGMRVCTQNDCAKRCAILVMTFVICSKIVQMHDTQLKAFTDPQMNSIPARYRALYPLADFC